MSYMPMKYLSFLFLPLLVSCSYFEKNKLDAQSLVEEEMQNIKWDDVDVYPTFANCEELSSNADKKNCFQNTLISHINKNLSEYVLVVSETVNDTVVLTLNCSNSGQLTIKNIKIKPQTKAQIQSIDSIILSGFDSLPKLYPAIKRSQPVATEFTLPIVIKTD
jgi:hypothetical protein